MNADAKQQWIEALRSGEFSQTQGHLQDGNGYCCLGVACEIFRRATGRGEWIPLEDKSLGFLDADTFLPDEVMEWLGIPQDSISEDYLIELNDSFIETFSEIADAIEHEAWGNESAK